MVTVGRKHSSSVGNEGKQNRERQDKRYTRERVRSIFPQGFRKDCCWKIVCFHFRVMSDLWVASHSGKTCILLNHFRFSFKEVLFLLTGQVSHWQLWSVGYRKALSLDHFWFLYAYYPWDRLSVDTVFSMLCRWHKALQLFNTKGSREVN